MKQDILLLLLLIGVINVSIAIFNKNASTQSRLFNLFSGLFALVTYFIIMIKII